MNARTFLKVAALASIGLALVLVPGTAWAGWMTGFKGHTVFGNYWEYDTGDQAAQGAADSIVSFGVYANPEGQDWASELGLADDIVELTLSSSGPGDKDWYDPTAQYVYFYQVVNTNPIPAKESPINVLNVYTPFASAVQSVGYLYNKVFFDPDGPSGPANVNSSNEELGIDANGEGASNDVADDVDDMTPTYVLPDPKVPTFGSDTSAIAPDPTAGYQFVTYAFEDDTRTYLQYTWDPELTTLSDYTDVVFFTSDTRPEFGVSQAYDGGPNYGDIPSPIPEPMPLLALLTGMPLAAVGLLRWRKKRKS